MSGYAHPVCRVAHSVSQLEQLGFMGFAIDFVDAPSPVMAFLNTYAGLHQAVGGTMYTTGLRLI